MFIIVMVNDFVCSYSKWVGCWNRIIKVMKHFWKCNRFSQCLTVCQCALSLWNSFFFSLSVHANVKRINAFNCVGIWILEVTYVNSGQVDLWQPDQEPSQNILNVWVQEVHQVLPLLSFPHLSLSFLPLDLPSSLISHLLHHTVPFFCVSHLRSFFVM